MLAATYSEFMVKIAMRCMRCEHDLLLQVVSRNGCDDKRNAHTHYFADLVGMTVAARALTHSRPLTSCFPLVASRDGHTWPAFTTCRTYVIARLRHLQKKIKLTNSLMLVAPLKLRVYNVHGYLHPSLASHPQRMRLLRHPTLVRFQWVQNADDCTSVRSIPCSHSSARS